MRFEDIYFQEPRISRRYPGLTQEESDIWKRYITKNIHMIDKVAYNIALEDEIRDISEHFDKMKKMWRKLTAKKIDVIIIRNEIISIVEVEIRATILAISQVLSYSILFEDKFNKKTENNMLVCAISDTDTEKIAEKLNIIIEKV
jgi:hypothetical protein